MFLPKFQRAFFKVDMPCFLRNTDTDINKVLYPSCMHIQRQNYNCWINGWIRWTFSQNTLRDQSSYINCKKPAISPSFARDLLAVLCTDFTSISLENWGLRYDHYNPMSDDPEISECLLDLLENLLHVIIMSNLL